MQYQLKVNAQAAAVTDERGHICLGDLTVIIPEAGDEWGQWILRVTEPPSLDYVCDGYPDRRAWAKARPFAGAAGR